MSTSSTFEIEELEPVEQSYQDLRHPNSSLTVDLKDKIFQELEYPELETIVAALPDMETDDDEVWTFENVLFTLSEEFSELKDLKIN